MAARGQENIREALLNIARNANDILRNYRSNETRNIERAITSNSNDTTASDNQENECTAGHLPRVELQPPVTFSTQTSQRSRLSPNEIGSSSTTAQPTVCDALRRAFPTFANAGGRKRGNSSNVSKKGKELAKKSKKQNSIAYKDIVLLPRPGEKSVPTHRTRIALENEGYVVHEFPINKSWDEQQLYSEIEKAFPMLDKDNATIQFVKACYGDIVVPKVAAGVSMNATRLLSIVGQGCIYLMPDRALGQSLIDGDDPQACNPDEVLYISDSELNNNPFEECVDDKMNKASTTVEPTKRQQKVTLKEIFPDIEEVELVNAIKSSDSIEEAVDFLTNTSSPEVSLRCLLEKLKEKMYGEDEERKLRVDEDDIVNDAMAYYKRGDFDPRTPLRIIYNGQPAADSGGVLRQFFTDLLTKLANTYFVGDGNKAPVYNSDILVCGIMKMIGIIIVHSLLQGGPGFPFLSKAVYWYVATGNVDVVVEHLTVEGCANPVYCNAINKLKTSGEMCSDILDVLSECGLTLLPTEENKDSLIQAILYHDALGRTKASLDQLRQGLDCLGFLHSMSQYPKLYEPLFVAGEVPLTSTAVVNMLRFSGDLDDEEQKTKGFLQNVLCQASTNDLEDFLKFVTGAPSCPNFGIQNIRVKFTSSDSIFASTCLCEILIPKAFENEDLFRVSLLSALEPTKKSFNCI